MNENISTLIIVKEWQKIDFILTEIKKSGYEIISNPNNLKLCISKIKQNKPKIIILDNHKKLFQLFNYIQEYKIAAIVINTQASENDINILQGVYLSELKNSDFIRFIQNPKFHIRDDYIYLNKVNNFQKINQKDIFFIKANDNYIEIHTSTKIYKQRETLKSIQKKLNPNLFKKVHRSYIVNKKFINKIYNNYLHINNHNIPVANSYKTKLKEDYTLA